MGFSLCFIFPLNQACPPVWSACALVPLCTMTMLTRQPPACVPAPSASTAPGQRRPRAAKG